MAAARAGQGGGGSSARGSMSEWRELARLISLRVYGTKRRRAFDYLESRGLRFCVHFGTDNAIAVAREHWRKLRRKRR